jgi:glucosamine--fructose-6-phosphate aminotransferase (isomerizing)
MRRCIRCIMPETVPKLSYDDRGICSYCDSYAIGEPFGEKALTEILDLVRGQGRPHDCMVPLSGGRDSTYTLYLAKEVYGLNPLAVNADNEFRSEQAVVNMERVCQALGVDFVSVRSKREIRRRFVQANVRASIPRGLPALTGAFCRRCSYGYKSISYIEASRRKIPLILWGTSSVESAERTHEVAAEGLRRSKCFKFVDPNLYRAEYYALLQRMEFHVPGNPLFSRKKPVLRDPSVREIRIFDYLPWDRRKIKEAITTQLGWQKPPDHATSWRTDCKLHEIVNYLWVKLAGCSVDCMGFCNMIVSGQMERAEALAQEEQIIATCGDHITDKLATAGLAPQEIARIVAVPAILDQPKHAEVHA